MLPRLAARLRKVTIAKEFSGMSDPLGQETSRWRRLWRELRRELPSTALLVIDDVERLPQAARMALEQPELAPVLLVADEAAETAQRVAVPPVEVNELAASLGRACAGLEWDASLLVALAAGVGAERALIWPLTATLLDHGLVVVGSQRVEIAPTVQAQTAVQQALLRQRRLTLPQPRTWPMWADLAVLGPHAVLPLQAQVATLLPDDATLLRRLPEGVALASPAVRAFLRSQLPGAVLAQAALGACRSTSDADLRVQLLLDAMVWGAQVLPSGVEAAAAVERRLARGEASEAAAMAETWLRHAAEDSPLRAALIALQLRALAVAGSESIAAKIAQLPEPARADPQIRLALAEVAFRRGDYATCRSEAAIVAEHSEPAVVSTAQLWVAFAATWQGDRQAAAAAVAAGQALAVPENQAFFSYLAALGDYYAGALDSAVAQLELLRQAAASTGTPLHAAAASGLGLCAQRRGDLTLARHWYETARQEAEVAGDRLRALNMAMNVATLDHEQGDLGRALVGYNQVVVAGRRAQNPGALARALGNRGNLLSQLGSDERARRDLDEALTFHQAQKNAYLSGNVGCVLAELARRAGHWQAAERLLTAAEADLTAAHAVSELLEVRLERGELLRVSGRLVEAEALAADALAAAAQLESPELQARALWLTARLRLATAAASAADLAATLELLRRAREFVPPSKPLLQVAIAAELARAEALAAQWGDAVRLARDTAARLDAIAATLPPAEAHAFRAGPAHGPTTLLLELLCRLPDAPVGPAAGPHALAPILAINRRMGAELELGAILEIVMDAAVLLTGAERGFLLLQHEGELSVMVARNLDRENLRKAALKLSWGIARQVFQAGERVLTTDALQDERFRGQASVHHGSLRSILCVPMAWQGKPIGALYVDNRFTSGAFSPDHAGLLEALADQAAIAVEHARLVQRERRALQKLRESEEEVQALAARLRVELEQTAHALVDARAELVAQRLDVQRRSDYSQIRGESPGLLRLFGLMDRVRDHDFPVLVCGESGTGKELVARAIHFTGRRQRGPFLAINCAALPSTLLESELFGHSRGAFTGAVVDRKGLFESADGGTLFLDEIGEMPLEMQPKLLRVLQSGELQRVGDTRTRKVDVRVVCATHRNLPEMAERGQFRQDLLFRLRVIELAIPPLRQRLEDIPLLVDHFLAENRKAGIGQVERLTPAALRRLREFAWPGNVRQLETVLKNAALFAVGTAIDAADLEPLLAKDKSADVAASARAIGENWWGEAPLEEIIRRAVADRVELAAGNKRRAAESLAIDRTTLYARLRPRTAGK